MYAQLVQVFRVLSNIEEVLEALVGAGLTANPDKCVWGAQSLEYLGHKLDMAL